MDNCKLYHVNYGQKFANFTEKNDKCINVNGNKYTATDYYVNSNSAFTNINAGFTPEDKVNVLLKDNEFIFPKKDDDGYTFEIKDGDNNLKSTIHTNNVEQISVFNSNKEELGSFDLEVNAPDTTSKPEVSTPEASVNPYQEQQQPQSYTTSYDSQPYVQYNNYNQAIQNMNDIYEGAMLFDTGMSLFTLGVIINHSF